MKDWFKKAFIALIEGRQAEANRRIAQMHLYRMTDRELRDIGIYRGDIKRVVNDEGKDNKKSTSIKKENGSWWEYFNSKLGWKLHKTNHA